MDERFKLTKKEPPSKFFLVFRCGEGELSQDLGYDMESECDRVLLNAVNGEGIQVRYPQEMADRTVMPSWIMKVEVKECYRLTNLETIRKYLLSSELPKHIGHNEIQPEKPE